jgi:site-specific recombinase XerD
MEHVVAERNLARNTQTSYRDTLALLLPFAAAKASRSVDKLTIENISPEVVRSFLLHIEQDRKCSISTRNQRLAAIHALAKFIAEHSPEHIAWCAEVRSIPFKKSSKPVMCYLEKAEMDAMLEEPDRSTSQGLRDYALLLFLYNTGARASEAAHVTVANLNLNGSASVKLVGKAGKIRHCPLWPATAKVLADLIGSRETNAMAFLNRLKQSITRFGINTLVKRYADKASRRIPSMATKQITAHTLRHTTAVHLLRAGVDINTIRAWLGHVSLNTTHIYAEIDLEMKANALAHCEIQTATMPRAQWRDNRGVMAFLKLF